MFRRFLLAMLLLAAATACSGYRKEIDQNPPFAPHHFRSYDLEVEWQSTQTGRGVLLTGTVTNRRAFYLRDLELTARVVDDHGKVIARGSSTDFPTYIPPGKTAPFRVEIGIPQGTAPEGVRFTYVYWLAEEPPAFRYHDEGPYFGHFDSRP